MYLALTVLLSIFTCTSSRIYDIKFSVDDESPWTLSNNASVYFTLITTVDGERTESPAFIIEQGLPEADIYSYSLLLDDYGEVQSLRLIHTDSNLLCINWISVDEQNLSTTAGEREYECTSQPSSSCQQIIANFSTKQITHSPGDTRCDWSYIHTLPLLKQYQIKFELGTTHNLSVYHSMGVSLEGFVFDAYYTPYYNLSHHLQNVVSQSVYGNFDQVTLSLITYDVTPIQSLLIATTRPDEAICINDVSVFVVGQTEYNVYARMPTSRCIVSNEQDSNGCNVLTVNFRADESVVEQQTNCEIASVSWEWNNEHRSETASYSVVFDVTDATEDYVFFQMEGHNGDKTECFYLEGFRLPLGRSEYSYEQMRNIGNPKTLYLLHDRDDNFCIDYISVHNEQTNETITHSEQICSEFLYDENDPGRCSVISINFETDEALSSLSEVCPFAEFCEFGLYEGSTNSSEFNAVHVAMIVLVIVVIASIVCSAVFGYQCIYCSSLYAFLIHCWDPFVNKYWNPKCGDRAFCCHCSNTTEMQHNLCCFCCGCDYCNPFSVHRRRMDKKTHDQIGVERKRKRKKGRNQEDVDEYDTEDIDDGINLNTLQRDKNKYDMGSMESINLGDNINIAGNTTASHSVPRYTNDGERAREDEDNDDDDEEDELGNVAGYRDSDDSAELALNASSGLKNRYTQIDNDVVEDAPMHTTGMYDNDDDDDMQVSGVLDLYDDPELR